jgi:hypothetical protein
MDSQDSIPNGGKDFSLHCHIQTISGSHLISNWVPRGCSQWYTSQGIKFNTKLQLVPKFTICGTLNPHSCTQLSKCGAWAQVEKSFLRNLQSLSYSGNSPPFMALKVHYHIHKNPPMDLIQCQMNPAHILSSFSLRFILILSYLSLGLPTLHSVFKAWLVYL